MDNMPRIVIEKIIEKFPSFRDTFEHCEENSKDVMSFIILPLFQIPVRTAQFLERFNF